MSEVKKPGKTPGDSNKDTPRGDGNAKDKKAGPKSKKSDSKKDLGRVEEASKASKDGKASKADSKKDLDGEAPPQKEGGKENSAQAAGQRETDEGHQQRSAETAKVHALAKSITDEFQQIAAYFCKNLDGAIKAASNPEAAPKLAKNHLYFRSLEGICRSAQDCARETFARVASSFEASSASLSKHVGVDVRSSLAKEAKELTELVAAVDREVKAVFAQLCRDELAESRKGYETVTVEGLDSKAEQRLMSANFAMKSAERGKAGEQAAVEATKVHRSVLPGLFDKVFVGYRDLSVSMAARRELKSEKTEQFLLYKKYFELKACPDVVVKGMGRPPSHQTRSTRSSPSTARPTW